MRRALTNLNTHHDREPPDNDCRLTADEGHIGRGHLSRVQDLEKETPVILTTSQLLTTGVDAPTCKNVVLFRVVGTMTDFKQIIGRGTRVRDDYGKLYFNILDYAGSATQRFADPDFDGYPEFASTEAIDDAGVTVPGSQRTEDTGSAAPPEDERGLIATGPRIREEGERHKYYVDGGYVEIVAQMAFELDLEGNRLRTVELTDYAAEKVRTLYPSAVGLRRKWADPEERTAIIEALESRGITFEQLASAANQPDADLFDLLCHIAHNAPLRTRRERADRLRREKRDFFDEYGPDARAVLDELLEKYAEHGTAEFKIPDILKVPPISDRGNVMEIAGLFGGAERLREAVYQMQALLYAA
jgi:type I restriction enzyme R subunit